MEIYEIAESFYDQLNAVIEAGYEPEELDGSPYMGVYGDTFTGELASVVVSRRHYEIGRVLLYPLIDKANASLKGWKSV